MADAMGESSPGTGAEARLESGTAKTKSKKPFPVLEQLAEF